MKQSITSQIHQAQSVEEIDGLLEHGKQFKDVSRKTLKRWERAAKRRKETLLDELVRYYR